MNKSSINLLVLFAPLAEIITLQVYAMHVVVVFSHVAQPQTIGEGSYCVF